ncbi:hypothetical protein [Antrihabitans stalactiti]|uniref:DUF4267 domain-containing protein n=1 Tax=Antrihabitans stalactiti TaxID=2584121 RepID=A0A848KQ63_9NOCA|nr:hypothetical protein [Antrihabitans stalactiti]NMN99064.1 hypothetical protein [Antrihabitans stalactiti]
MTGLSWIRAGWGTMLIAAPPSLRTPAGPLDRRGVLIARVLGARQFAQAAVVGSTSSHRLLAVSTGVDALHAASMLAVGAMSQRHRKTAITDALIATGFAVSGYATTWRRQ